MNKPCPLSWVINDPDLDSAIDEEKKISLRWSWCWIPCNLPYLKTSGIIVETWNDLISERQRFKTVAGTIYCFILYNFLLYKRKQLNYKKKKLISYPFMFSSPQNLVIFFLLIFRRKFEKSIFDIKKSQLQQNFEFRGKKLRKNCMLYAVKIVGWVTTLAELEKVLLWRYISILKYHRQVS